MRNSTHNFPSSSDRHLQRLYWDKPTACLPPDRQFRMPWLMILLSWVCVVALLTAAVYAFNAGFAFANHTAADRAVIRALASAGIAIASGLLAMAVVRAGR